MNNNWLTLVISLPGRSPTPRMRIWRALKAGGAGILRDGVYVLPDNSTHRALFEKQADEVNALEGSAYVLEHNATSGSDAFEPLFDRSKDYVTWNEHAVTFKESIGQLEETKARREETQLRRELESITSIDFFATHVRDEAEQAMIHISETINRHFSPDEPSAQQGQIKTLNRKVFTNRVWATRKNLWVDRVASAWLIKRHIDKSATFLWLEKTSDCPSDALGFDFDGATFSHVGGLVTFETLLASFQLESNEALVKMGDLVHYLDVGGVSVPEAAGFLTLLAGTKNQTSNDDEFSARTFELLDTFYAAFSASIGAQES